jgi:hypothetical protein
LANYHAGNRPDIKREQFGDGLKAGFSRRVAVQGVLHLDIEAIIRSQEIGADQQQDDVGFLEIPVDRLLPEIARADLPVVPASHQTLPLEQLEVLRQFIPQRFVAV